MKPGTLVRRTRDSNTRRLLAGDVGLIINPSRAAHNHVWVQWLRTGVKTMPPLYILEEITDEQL